MTLRFTTIWYTQGTMEEGLLHLIFFFEAVKALNVINQWNRYIQLKMEESLVPFYFYCALTSLLHGAQPKSKLNYQTLSMHSQSNHQKFELLFH